MERGEVRWYTFKSPDKKRPVVILTRNSAISFLGEVTITPVTTTIRSIPTEVVLDEQDGMKALCAVNLDHVQTVAKNRIGNVIAKLTDDKLSAVRAALNFALGFD